MNYHKKTKYIMLFLCILLYNFSYAASVQRDSQNPAESNVTASDKVTVQSTGTTNLGENVYIKYTTDGWTTIKFVFCDGSGYPTFVGEIPTQTENTTVEYGLIVTDGDSNGNQLAFDFNGGSNYSYVVSGGGSNLTSPVVHSNGSVTFNYQSSSATSVAVRGTFNDWAIKTMTQTNDTWSVTVTGLTNGTAYYYKFFVNGTDWILDPLNSTTGEVDGITNSKFTAVFQGNQTPTISLTSPNGGETWSGNQNIIYSASDADGDNVTIKIEISSDMGSTWTTVSIGESNTGSYSLNTANYADGTYHIKVSATDGEDTGTDISASSFTIDNSGGSNTSNLYPNPLGITAINTDYSIDLTVDVSDSVFGCNLKLSYDPNKISISDITEGSFFNKDGEQTVLQTNIDNNNGQVVIGLSRLGDISEISGSGTVCTIKLQAKQDGTANLNFSNFDFINKSQSSISISSPTGIINVSSSNVAPVVSVTSPNGGESWSGQKNITWTATDSDGDNLTVSVYYSSDNGINYNLIQSGLSNSGSYTWNTSNVNNGSNYKVKVTASDGVASTSDESDAKFSISNSSNQIPSLSITSPDGGETVGNSLSATWTATDADNDILTIDVYYTSSLSGAQTAVSLDEVNDGSYLWDLASLSAGDYYLILYTTDGQAIVSDTVTSAIHHTTDATSLEINPVTKEVTNTNEQFSVSLMVKNVTNMYGGNINVFFDTEYLTCDDATEGSFLGSDGQTTWFLKSINNSTGKINLAPTRVGSVGGVSGNGTLATITFTTLKFGSTNITISNSAISEPDQSNIDFIATPSEITIGSADNPPSVSIIAPNGGESVNGTYNIQWTASDADGDAITITIQYTSDGSNYNNIITELSNTGSYSWNSSDVSNGDYKIRIRAIANGAVSSAESISYFSVSNGSDSPTISITNPGSGEVISGTYQIKWAASDPNSKTLSITIDVSNDNGTSYSNIVTNTTNTGSYNWNTVTTSDGTQCKLRFYVGNGSETVTQYSSIFAIQNGTSNPILKFVDGTDSTIVVQNVTAVGEIFNISVKITNISDMFVANIYAYYDKDKVKINSITEGDFLNSDGKQTFFLTNINNDVGKVNIAPRRVGSTGVTGSGILANIEMQALALGQVSLTFDSATTSIKDPSQNNISVLLSAASFTIGTTNHPPSIILGSPNSGEYNGNIDVNYTASDPDGDTVTIKIEYREKSSGTWNTIASGLSNSGQYTFNSISINDGDYYIKVTASDDSSSASATSSSYITINNAGNSGIVISPSIRNVNGINQIFSLNVDIQEVNNLYQLSYKVKFNSNYMTFLSASEGTFMNKDGEQTSFLSTQSTGKVSITQQRVGVVAGVSGSGNLSALNFNSIGESDVDIEFENIIAKDAQGNTIPLFYNNGQVKISSQNVDPFIKVISPNGGEVWGDNHLVQWIASDSDVNDSIFISIKISSDNGATWQNVITGISNTGEYLFDASSYSSGSNYKIRVIADDSKSTVFDVSDNTFEISQSKPKLKFYPSLLKISTIGNTLSADIKVENITNMFGANIYLVFDTNIVQIESISEGDFMSSDGSQTFFLSSIDNDNGLANIAPTRLGSGISGSGTIATVVFKAKGNGVDYVEFKSNTEIQDSAQNPIPAILVPLKVNMGVVNSPPEVSLTSPSGGSIISGITNIKWTAVDDDNDSLTVTLFVSSDGGSNWSTITSNISNTGSYSWNTSTMSDGSNYRIKVLVSDDTYSSIAQNSTSFTIQNVSSMELYFDPATVTESNIGASGSVNISVKSILNLYGANIYVIYDTTYITITDVTEGPFLKSDGTPTFFLKTIDAVNGLINIAPTRSGSPSTVGGVNGSGDIATIEFDTLKYGVSTLSFKSNTVLKDTDQMEITVTKKTGTIKVGDYNTPPSVDITYPATDSILSSLQNIQWTATDAENDNITVNLYYSNDSGITYNEISTGESNDGYYSWNTSLYSNGDYIIKIIGDDGNDTGYDTSGLFQIYNQAQNNPPVVDLTAPTGGEICTGTKEITWTATDSDSDPINIFLYYSSDNGANYYVIGSNINNNGSYLWNTTQVTDGALYKIKIVASDGLTSSFDVSDIFTVNNDNNSIPRVSVDKPGPGDIVSEIYTVKWTATDSDGDNLTISILYSRDSENWISITNNLSNSGEYNWNTDGLVNASDYRVKVIVSDGTMLNSDISGIFSIQNQGNNPPVVVLNSPNGGENWSGEKTIFWTATDADNDTLKVFLEYSNDAVVWESIASNEANDGAYTWNTSNAPSGLPTIVRIRVSDGKTIVADQSDEVFTIVNQGDNQAPTVSITAPTPGSTLSGNYTISWTSNDDQTDVEDLKVFLQYSTNGSIWTNIASNINNSGTYVWNTNTVPNGTSYYLKVMISDGNKTGFDIINGTFKISNSSSNSAPTVNLLAPADTNTYSGSLSVSWTASDADNDPLTVKLFYSFDNGQSWTTITSGVNLTSPYSWDSNSVPDGNYKIKVSVNDDINAEATDQSLEFSIDNSGSSVNTPPSLSIIQPNGGEVFAGTQKIKWNASDIDAGDVITIKLEYSSDSGTNYNIISSSLSNSGSYDWNTTELQDGSEYIVRVTASDGEDETKRLSSGTFTVNNNSTLLGFSPSSGNISAINETLEVELQISNVTNLLGCNIYISYDTKVVIIDSVSEGDFLNSDGTMTWFLNTVNNDKGEVNIAPTRVGTTGVSGNGTLGTITFKAIGLGESGITFITSKTTVKDPNQSNIDYIAGSGNIVVGAVNTPPTVKVLVPNGAESVQGSYNILWSASDADGDNLLITLQYSTNNVNWTTIASNLSNSHSYSWNTTSLNDGSSYMIKVIANDGTVTSSDVSDNVFSISNGGQNTAPTVKITSPTANSTDSGIIDIAWTASDNENDPLTVKISYKDNSSSTTTWVELTNGSISSPYSWNSNTILDGDSYYLKVTVSDGNLGASSTTGPIAISNGSGNHIPFISLTYPTYGASISDTVEISWSATDVDGDQTKIDIYYSLNNNNTTVIASDVLDTNYYYWYTGTISPDSTEYRLYLDVEDTSGSGDKGYVLSDKFTLNNINETPTVNMTYPTGGESLSGEISITWSASDNDNDDINITIQYSQDQVTWTNITSNHPNTGNYVWNTISASNGTYYMRIIANDGNYYAKQKLSSTVTISNASSNKSPVVTLINPLKGDVVKDNLSIKWTATDANNDDLTVSIQYSDDNTNWTNIIQNYNNLGTYTWDSNNAPDGLNYYIRLLVSDGELFTEISTGPITISNNADLSGTNLAFSPTKKSVDVNDEFDIELKVNNAEDLFGGNIYLNYDADILTITSDDITEGDFLKSDGTPMTFFLSSVNGDTINVAPTRLTGGIDGSGILANLKFTAKANGSSNVSFNTDKTVLKDSSQQNISSITFTNSLIKVGANNDPVVSISSPTDNSTVSGDAVISYNATDADGDDLTVTIRYSIDNGVSWTNIISNTSITSGYNTYTWNTDNLITNSNYTLKIIVSDGFATDEATVSSLTVSNVSTNNPPVLNINAPTGNSSQSGNITFEWNAYDTDGQSLSIGIYYSTDNVAYKELAINLKNDSSEIINSEMLTDNSYYFKIIADDGKTEVSNVISGVAVSNNVSNHPPLVILYNNFNNHPTIADETYPISFKSEDADNDSVYVTLSYTTDKTTYTNITSGYLSSYYNWDLSSMTTSDTYYIRLSGFDGTETSSVISSIFGINSSNNIPVVTLTAPNAGSQISGNTTISWNASDTDNDKISVNLFYSLDGSSWTKINPTSLKNAQNSAYTWNTSDIPYAASVYIRVEASDIYGATGNDEIDSPISILNGDAPTVSFIYPSSNVTMSGKKYIKWTWYDGDSDTCYFTLKYLDANSNWIVIVKDLINADSYFWNTVDAPNTNNGKLLIEVTDGDMTGTDVSVVFKIDNDVVFPALLMNKARFFANSYDTSKIEKMEIYFNKNIKINSSDITVVDQFGETITVFSNAEEGKISAVRYYSILQIDSAPKIVLNNYLGYTRGKLYTVTIRNISDFYGNSISSVIVEMPLLLLRSEEAMVQLKMLSGDTSGFIVLPANSVDTDVRFELIPPTTAKNLVQSRMPHNALLQKELTIFDIKLKTFNGDVVGDETSPLNDYAELYFSYEDSDNDGIIDGTNIPTSYLKVCRYNENTGEWEKVKDFANENKVFTSPNLIYAKVKHFSLYSVLALSPPDRVEVSKLYPPYPNPFKPAIHDVCHLEFGVDETDKGELTAVIFDIQGHIVRKFTEHNFVSQSSYYTGEWKELDTNGDPVNITAPVPHDGAEPILWDGKNSEGELVQSGVYLFTVINSDGEPIDSFKKIMVIR